jgi:hypothetical protein
LSNEKVGMRHSDFTGDSRSGKAAGTRTTSKGSFFLQPTSSALLTTTTSHPTLQNAFAQLCPVGASTLAPIANSNGAKPLLTAASSAYQSLLRTAQASSRSAQVCCPPRKLMLEALADFIPFSEPSHLCNGPIRYFQAHEVWREVHRHLNPRRWYWSRSRRVSKDNLQGGQRASRVGASRCVGCRVG